MIRTTGGYWARYQGISRSSADFDPTKAVRIPSGLAGAIARRGNLERYFWRRGWDDCDQELADELAESACVG